jgi:hypothetical protein
MFQESPKVANQVCGKQKNLGHADRFCRLLLGWTWFSDGFQKYKGLLFVECSFVHPQDSSYLRYGSCDLYFKLYEYFSAIHPQNNMVIQASI